VARIFDRTFRRKTASDYMRIAAKVDEGHLFRSETSIDEAVGRNPRSIKSITKANKLKALRLTWAPAS
jgi:hypothetical protein